MGTEVRKIVEEVFLNIYVIYKHPKDYPDQFVMRRHVCKSNGSHGPTKEFYLGKTLEEVKKKLPYGLVCLNRDPKDDPVIVETWL